VPRTGGSGDRFLRPEFAGELSGAGQLFEATKCLIVLPGASDTANPSSVTRRSRGDPAIRGHAWPWLAHDRSALEATFVETAR
jgi:hypothetical protein